jgi:hypothetical protein
VITLAPSVVSTQQQQHEQHAPEQRGHQGRR